MPKILKNNISLFAIMIVLLSCDIETGLNVLTENDNELKATFSSIEESVFRVRCALSGCHASDTRSAGLDLSTSEAYNSLVDVPSVLSVQDFDRVEPFDSDSSFLINVLDGSNPTRMPLNGSPLDNATIDKIKQWINEGAQNN